MGEPYLDHWGVVSSLMNNVIKGANLASPCLSSSPVQKATAPTHAIIMECYSPATVTTGEDCLVYNFELPKVWAK